MIPIRRALALAIFALLLSGCTADSTAHATDAPAALETEEQKTMYALGLAMAQGLAQLALTEDELKLVKQGMSDAVLGREAAVDLQEYGPKIQALSQERMAAAAEREGTASKEFFDKMAAEEGAVKTEDGFVIFELTPGTGASPAESDTVTVHYHGTLRDGTVFDSSVDRGEPATFGLGQVIPCWRKGLTLMKEGGKSKLVCPAELAYGSRGAPPKISPGATLVFEVELISIGGAS